MKYEREVNIKEILDYLEKKRDYAVQYNHSTISVPLLMFADLYGVLEEIHKREETELKVECVIDESNFEKAKHGDLRKAIEQYKLNQSNSDNSEKNAQVKNSCTQDEKEDRLIEVKVKRCDNDKCDFYENEKCLTYPLVDKRLGICATCIGKDGEELDEYVLFLSDVEKISKKVLRDE